MALKMKKNFIALIAVFVVVGFMAGFMLTSLATGGTKTPTGAAAGTGNDEPASFEEGLARCLTANGVKMYGAYWCPHCKNQKAMFGDAFQYVDYVECTQEQGLCNAAGINGYPTWVGPDGVKHPGEKPLDELAELFGCGA